VSYYEDVRAEREADALLEAGIIVRCPICGWNNPAGELCEQVSDHPQTEDRDELDRAARWAGGWDLED